MKDRILSFNIAKNQLLEWTKIKAFQFYKVEVFNNELIKNLSKVARSANKTLLRILKFYEGLKSGTTYKDKKGPTNTSKYIDNNIF